MCRLGWLGGLIGGACLPVLRVLRQPLCPTPCQRLHKWRCACLSIMSLSAPHHATSSSPSRSSSSCRLGVTGFLDSRLDPAFQSKLARLRSCRDVLLLRLDISAMNLSDWHSAAEQLMKQQEQDQDESEADADPSLTAAATASEQQANPSSGRRCL